MTTIERVAIGRRVIAQARRFHRLRADGTCGNDFRLAKTKSGDLAGAAFLVAVATVASCRGNIHP